jgi:hypothetical protein
LNACASLAPSAGTPCSRSAADNYFSCDSCRDAAASPQQDLAAFTTSMASLIHSIDPTRPISSGNSFPRAAAHHLSVTPCPPCDFTADSPDEYASVLANLHPAGVDIVSVHHPDIDGARLGDDDPNAVALLARTERLAESMGKQLYVGEYAERRPGSVTCNGSTEACGGDASRVNTRRILDALVASRVAWSAIWGYEFYPACAGVPTCYTVTDDDDIVDAIVVHDSAVGACGRTPDGVPCPIGVCAGSVCQPVREANWQFASDGDASSWSSWTNCTGCTPGSFAFAGSGSAGDARLETHDLPCGAGCQFPGAYALSPPVAIGPGHALVTFDARASGTGAVVNLLAAGGSGESLGEFPAGVSAGSDLRKGALWATLPAGTASLRIRLEVPVANATLDVRTIEIVWEP